MADPITLAIGAAVAGSAVSTVSQVQGGYAKAGAARYNQQIDNQNAQIAIQEAAENERTFRINSGKQIGSIRAGYGAAGVSGGSSIDVLGAAAANAELDAQKIRYAGKMKSLGYEQSGNLQGAAADQAVTGGYLSAAGTLLNSGSGIYKDINSGYYGGMK